jgi:hypothetical protein
LICFNKIEEANSAVLKKKRLWQKTGDTKINISKENCTVLV